MSNHNAYELSKQTLIETTNVGSRRREYIPEPLTKEVEPKGLTVSVGNLLIVQQAGPGPNIGYRTQVFLDGKEVKQVRRLTLDIGFDEITKATLEVLV